MSQFSEYVVNKSHGFFRLKDIYSVGPDMAKAIFAFALRLTFEDKKKKKWATGV